MNSELLFEFPCVCIVNPLTTCKNFNLRCDCAATDKTVKFRTKRICRGKCIHCPSLMLLISDYKVY